MSTPPAQRLLPGDRFAAAREPSHLAVDRTYVVDTAMHVGFATPAAGRAVETDKIQSTSLALSAYISRKAAEQARPEKSFAEQFAETDLRIDEGRLRYVEREIELAEQRGRARSDSAFRYWEELHSERNLLLIHIREDKRRLARARDPVYAAEEDISLAEEDLRQLQRERADTIARIPDEQRALDDAREAVRRFVDANQLKEDDLRVPAPGEEEAYERKILALYLAEEDAKWSLQASENNTKFLERKMAEVEKRIAEAKARLQRLQKAQAK